MPASPERTETLPAFKHQRLGKLVEEFVFHQLKSAPAVVWICDSLQIQQEKRTVGEIDALYYDQETVVHLEVAYKFYLYDKLERHADPLACWIGPNRKDKLSQKLAKLRNKQFPLLHNPLSQPYLKAHDLDAQSIEQRLCFKGQLFLPYGDRHIELGALKQECVVGFYLSFHKIDQLKGLEFYVPEKLDWLATPHHAVGWLGFPAAIARIRLDVDNGRSPLVWLRYPNGKLRKCFMVFW